MKLTPLQEMVRKAVINAALDPRLSIHQFRIDDLCAIADMLEWLMRLNGYRFSRYNTDQKKPEIEVSGI